MKREKMIKPWLTAAILVLLVSSCATTQEEIIEDSPPLEAPAPADDAGVVDDSTTGADASELGDADDGSTMAIADEDPMTVREMLEKTDGVLANRTIYFEFDSARLTAESTAILETHGDFIAGHSQVSLRLEGHADERGSREYNIALGDRRAQSVRRLLLFQGVSVDQMETVSYGEEQPAVSGHNEAAWAKNRRVELLYKVN